MPVSYNRLWTLLTDKKMSRAELRRIGKISPNTMTKLIRNKEVSLSVLCRICEALDTNIGCIVDFVRDGQDRAIVRRGAEGNP